MRKPELIYEENESYIEQLKTFKKRGVKVLIDGVEQPESKWKELLKVSDDGGFYMGDYITGKEGEDEKEILKEIRFEKIRLK
ncbi:MAG: hypothetical protein ACOYBV_04840 [Candidatus Avilachnospira sp.]|jgi:hypothetical protein